MEQNKPFTNEERLALAAKLDKELDDFIDGLERRPYTEGWPEDRWQEEMEKHPFFMKKAPEAGEQLSPLMEGLQQLKYDPKENTPEELANAYKEDGNFNFKHKNYRLAIIAYTEGLKVKCNNTDIDATLYNNRSAANYFLKNYRNRSSLRDCEWALKLKPDYSKTVIRAANCCFEIKQFDKAIEYCDFLLKEKEDAEILQLRQKISNKKKEEERNLRKLQKLEEQKNASQRELIKAIIAAGVKLEGDLRPVAAELSEHTVHLSNGKLVWPVIFTYPEYKTMDFVQEFHEDVLLGDQLSHIFNEYPDWDDEKKYKLENMSLYFENPSANKLYSVNLGTSLKDVLKHNQFIVRAGTPSFIILIQGSLAEASFIKLYQ